MSCLFCKIIQKEVPAENIYEDDELIVFLDINPVNPGHALVVPKKHFDNFIELPEDITASIFQKTKKIAEAIMRAVAADSFNLGVNNGGAAGQEIMHFHLHIIPRFQDDAIKMWPGKPYSEGEVKKVGEAIRKQLL